jgi:hypothetical protein
MLNLQFFVFMRAILLDKSAYGYKYEHVSK